MIQYIFWFVLPFSFFFEILGKSWQQVPPPQFALSFTSTPPLNVHKKFKCGEISKKMLKFDSALVKKLPQGAGGYLVFRFIWIDRIVCCFCCFFIFKPLPPRKIPKTSAGNIIKQKRRANIFKQGRARPRRRYGSVNQGIIPLFHKNFEMVLLN